MAERRARFVRGGARGIFAGLTPFQTRCLLAFGVGAGTLGAILNATSPIVGAVVVLTLGAGMLLLVVALDYFDLLVDRGEYLVLAAHPHDDWSVLLAKLAVFTRTTMILGTCLFSPAAVAIAFTFHSVWAGVAFLLGGYGVTLTVSWAAVFLSAAAVAAGGHQAMNRVLPWLQAVYIALYLGFFSSRRFLRHVAVPDLGSLGALPWLLPTAWFAAPLELVGVRASPSAWLRGGLALTLMGGLVAVGGRWISSRFGERMLEPESGRAPAAWVDRGASKGRGAVPADISRAARRRGDTGARGAFWILFRAQWKADYVFRMQFVSLLIAPAVLCLSLVNSGSSALLRSTRTVTALAAFVLGTMLPMGSFAMGRSSRPSRIWCVLTSPVSREDFAMAPVGLLRRVLVLPATAMLSAYLLWRGDGPPLLRPLPAIAAALLWEDVLMFARGFTPDPPFSKPFKSAARTGWGRFAVGLYLYFTMGFAVLLLGLAGFAGTAGYTGLIVLFALARAGLQIWVRRRVRSAAARFEPLDWAA
ncbi:MAG TPA: hypothetical protein VF363_08390 [Candidatus Eisenbacteria bacterium]